jgi:hypothetical protein
MLNTQQVLPLQEARQPKVKPHGVDRDIYARARPQVVIGELRDERIGILDGELVEESHIPQFLQDTEVCRGHCVADLTGAGIARDLEILPADNNVQVFAAYERSLRR